MNNMDLARKVLCPSIHSIRKLFSIPSIQPLKTATFFKTEEFDWFLLSPVRGLIQDECNVKLVDWDFVLESDYEEFGITYESKLDFREAGKLLGKDTQRIGSLVSKGEYVIGNHANEISVGGLVIPANLVSRKCKISYDFSTSLFATAIGNNSFLVLDTEIYPHLYIERLAQEIIKEINRRRRELSYSVSDEVVVSFTGPSKYFTAIDMFKNRIEKDGKCILLHEDNAVHVDFRVELE